MAGLKITTEMGNNEIEKTLETDRNSLYKLLSWALWKFFDSGGSASRNDCVYIVKKVYDYMCDTGQIS